MNLIYYSFGSDDRFRNLIDLSIESVRKYGKYTGDIAISECRRSYGKGICDPEESSINKLNINKLDLSKYEKVLYLDSDVLVCGDVNPIFSKIKKISVGEERELMCGNNWFGAYMFRPDEIYECVSKKIYGINAGIFGFTANYAKYLLDIMQLVDSDPNRQSYAEQPSFNRYLFKNQHLYEPNLTGDVVLFAKPDRFKEYAGKTFLHFCGGIGSYDRKLFEMKEMMRLLNDSY